MSSIRGLRFVSGLLCCLALIASHGWAANITWVGGDGTWSDGAAGDANWNPDDEPDSNDVAIFNTNNAIDMASDNIVAGLTMSASAELALAGNSLSVAGATTLSGSGTRLEAAGADAALIGQDFTINNGSTVFVDAGSLESAIAGAGVATITINSGGVLSGNGAVLQSDALGAATTVINNNGTISAINPPLLVISPPAAAALAISATDVDARIDLDGSLESGTVNVGRNQTLDIDVALADIFNGAVTMSHNTKLDVALAWILGAGATIDVNNGATGGIGGAPAGTATIAGNSFSQNSGTITVLDADGTLEFEAPFTLNGGSLVNNGLVIFDSSSTIAAAANFTMPTATSSIKVEANRTLTISQSNFNLDGANSLTNVITVNAGGFLNVSTTDYDPDSAANAFDGTIVLNDGDISVTTGDAEFVMDGVLTMSSTVDGANVAWNGEALDLGNDAGALDADLNVTGTQQSQFGSPVDFNSDADVDIAAGATLALLSTVNFNTVNAANNAQFTGAGRIAFSGAVNVSEAVTLNMVGGEIDLDGLDAVGDFVNIDAPLVINAATMAAFGRTNGGGGVNTLDVNNSVGTGALTVNLDNADAEWTLNAQGVINLVNDNTAAVLLDGSDVNLNGTVNVTGDVQITARVDIGGTVNLNTAGQPLQLGGGGLNSDVNTIAGGTITGAGTLNGASNRALHGHGTINSSVDFDGTANLLADDGTLTLAGPIVDVNLIGTNDDDAILNVTSPWNTNVAQALTIRGGEVRGATITNDGVGGILGDGLLSARVINNTKLSAGNALHLIVETAGNDNDWDGTTNAGMLIANFGRTLEIRDTGAAFGFGGTVSAADGGRVFSDGFALDFNPGSTLSLTAAKYQSSSSTDLGGAVAIGAGLESTIEVENNSFLTFETGSTTTLGGDVRLVNNNINIEAGATFSGAGALVVPDGSHMVGDNSADIGVLLNLQGAFRPGNSQGIGRVEILDYQSTSTSELFVELTGTGLNQFDRLVIDGDAIVDGYLNIDIDEVSPGVPFVPALGNTFNIITGNSVTGTFDFADVSGMPDGLAFHIAYLANAVQLQVVSMPLFSADFDEDGDVDPTDLAIWDGAFDLNQLGDADGDNDSDGNDFLIWQRQVGSKPAVAAQAPVPEPAGFICAMIAAAAAESRSRGARRRRAG